MDGGLSLCAKMWGKFANSGQKQTQFVFRASFQRKETAQLLLVSARRACNLRLHHSGWVAATVSSSCYPRCIFLHTQTETQVSVLWALRRRLLLSRSCSTYVFCYSSRRDEHSTDGRTECQSMMIDCKLASQKNEQMGYPFTRVFTNCFYIIK